MITPHSDCVDLHRDGLTSFPWTLIPGFLIRSTGFPFETLDALRLTDSHCLGMQAVTQQHTVQALQHAFNADLFADLLDHEQRQGAPSDVFASWYKLNRCVHKGMPCPDTLRAMLEERNAEMGTWINTWNVTLAEVAATQSAVIASVTAELSRARALLHDVAQDERFREALLLSNPNMFTVALPSYLRSYDLARRPNKARQLERRLYSYLQRFCTKNDTTSFFGPIDYGWFDLSASEALTYQRADDERLGQRLTRLSFWATQALADLIAADPAIQPHLVPYLQHGCRLLPGGELSITVRKQRVRLSESTFALLQRIDGLRTAADLCEGDARAWDELLRLRDKGLVIWRLEIPTAVFNPLEWLSLWVQHVQEDCTTRVQWMTHLAWFQQALERFTLLDAEKKLQLLQDIEERFTALTGQEARRGEGSIYVDRLLLYDEAQGAIEHCTVGQSLGQNLLTQLRPTLDLCSSYSTLVQEVCQRHAQALFQEMGGEPQPYLAFIRALDERVSLETCLADPLVQDYGQRLVDLAVQRQHDERICLTSDDLRPFQRAIPAGTVVSPDLFLAASDVEALATGQYQAIIGEIHYGAQVWCHFLTFCTCNDELASALASALPEPTQGRLRAVLVHRRTQGKTFYRELPGLSVEVLGRSTKPRECVLPVADLEVATDETGLILRSRSLGQSLELYAADPRSVSNWLFCTPPVLMPSITMEQHTPRIEIDEIVYQRERWTLCVADILPPTLGGDASALLLHGCELRRRYGLPERAFARVPSERKPFYVDFANVFSLELFLNMIQNDQTVTLSEVLPSPDKWWLSGQRGTYSCEWRMTAVYGGQHG